MANIYPFRALRYSGPPDQLVTQPYDTIPSELEAQYRAVSHNLVHLILPGTDYAGAGASFRDWAAEGVLVRDTTPAIYVYEQRFPLPETGEALVRRGFIALGDTQDRSIHPHERTLDAPLADRLELLRHTRAQFGSIFMVYSDPPGEVEALLDAETQRCGVAEFIDHQGTTQILWRIDDPECIAKIQAAMRGRALMIADGHHRYQAALQFGAPRTMMMFVRLESPGLRSLAAHRVVTGLPGFRPEMLDSVRQAKGVRFEVVLPGGVREIELELPEGALNLTVLHQGILRDALGITPEDIARQRYVRYRRGRETAIREVMSGAAQVAFLVEPLRVDEVARLAFSGQILPQKSTDFYPKLLSGLTIYDFAD